MNLPRKQIHPSNLFYTIPFATVFLLLLVVISTYSVFVSIPGLPINLAYPPQTNSYPELLQSSARVITIKSNGRVLFEKKEFAETEFYERIKNLFKLPSSQQLLFVKAEPGVSSLVVKKLTDYLNSLNLKVQIAYDLPDLPALNPVIGATGAMVFVLVDPNGLFYFENQMIDEVQLRIKLSSIVQKAKEPLTLVVIADKSVPYEFIVKLGSTARSAGINKLLLATRPSALPYLNE
ncbi:MAG: ExbD/TolR family protein [Verrucomicrobiia bacterium]